MHLVVMGGLNDLVCNLERVSVTSKAQNKQENRKLSRFNPHFHGIPVCQSTFLFAHRLFCLHIDYLFAHRLFCLHMQQVLKCSSL